MTEESSSEGSASASLTEGAPPIAAEAVKCRWAPWHITGKSIETRQSRLTLTAFLVEQGRHGSGMTSLMYGQFHVGWFSSHQEHRGERSARPCLNVAVKGLMIPAVMEHLMQKGRGLPPLGGGGLTVAATSALMKPSAGWP